jgi:hypothetical protein
MSSNMVYQCGGLFMCILRPRLLLLVWGVVAMSTLAPQLAVAQGSPYAVDSQEYGGAAGTDSATSSGANSFSQVLTAAGVPNQAGRLQWPVGLRVVGGPESDKLRQQIEALLQYGAWQTLTGRVSAHVTQELTRSVRALRKLLRRDREERFNLALISYEDAEHFLDKLDHARKLFEANPQPPGEKDR